MATNNNRQDSRTNGTAKSTSEWSSDDDCHGSEEDWRSDNEWNEDSSIAGEASEETAGEQHDDEEERPQRDQKPKDYHNTQLAKLNLDDVGTEDDGESRHLEDITDRTDGKTSKTNASDISDLSDIEDQIVEAQNKLMDDKQSLSGVLGLVDEVTIKGEKLTRKVSETSLTVERDTLRKGTLSNQFRLFDEDEEISFRSYTESNVEEDQIPQRDLGKMVSGRIEYINNAEREKDVPKLLIGLGQIEYQREDKSESSGSLIYEEEASISKSSVKGTNDDGKSNTSGIMTEAEDQQSGGESNVKSTKSSETFISRISNKLEDEREQAFEEDDIQVRETPVGSVTTEDNDDAQDRLCNSPELPEYDDPECSKLGEKHLCCFFNLGGGGDGERQNELVDRLKKLKDDLANMRKELSVARQECKKESEEVAKLIEAAAARNQAAEQNEIALPNFSQQFTLEDSVPTAAITQATVLPARTQVAIPTSLLEDRLRNTRLTASSTYRASLNELERMVEKEMASIQDSMTRLEPLNKISAEWDTVLPIRDPTRTTYKSDYRMEMVTSEMLLKAPEVRTATIQEMK